MQQCMYGMRGIHIWRMSPRLHILKTAFSVVEQNLVSCRAGHLESGRSTQWQRYRPFEEAAQQLRYSCMPRRRLRISELSGAALGSYFDCTALALHVGPLHDAGGELLKGAQTPKSLELWSQESEVCDVQGESPDVAFRRFRPGVRLVRMMPHLSSSAAASLPVQ